MSTPATPTWATGRAALSVKDVAAACGVSMKTVRRWISNESLPSVRICGAGARAMIFILPSDLDQWLRAARHDPSAVTESNQSIHLQGRRFLGAKSPLDIREERASSVCNQRTDA